MKKSAVFLVNSDNNTFEKVYTSKEKIINMQDLIPFCHQYQSRLKKGEWLLSATFEPLQDRFVADYLATYTEEKKDFPFYFDIAEHDERVLFDRIVNHNQGIIYSDELRSVLFHDTWKFRE